MTSIDQGNIITRQSTVAVGRRRGGSAAATFARCAIIVACFLGGAGRGLAQVSAEGATATKLPVPNQSPEQLMAHQVMLVAWQVLHEPRLEEDLKGKAVTPDQLLRARLLLDHAIRLDPESREALRLRWRIAELEQDHDAVKRILRQYLKLEPDQDGARYALIQEELATYQSLDARASAIGKLLSADAAKGWSEALRSRLQTELAAAAEERGDGKAHLKHLLSAVQLDTSNKRATEMVLREMVARKSDPARVGVAIINVLRADPLDAEQRLALARLLRNGRAYEAAAEQFAYTHRITGRWPDSGAYAEWVFCLAASGQTDGALGLLEQLHSVYAPREKEAADNPRAGGGDALTAPKPAAPSRSHLPLDLQLVRSLVLERAGRSEEAKLAFETLQSQLAKREKAARGVSDLDLLWWSVYLGKTFDDIDDRLKPFLALEASDARRQLAQRIEGWHHLQAGRLTSAARALAPLAQRDAYAMYGLARVADRSERLGEGQTVRLLEKTIAAAPTDLAAMCAAMDARALQHRLTLAEDVLPVIELMKRWHHFIEPFEGSRLALISMGASMEPKTADYLEPLVLKLTLRNTTNAPLAIGGEGGTPASAVVSIVLKQDGAMVGHLEPMVIDLGGHLRIEPGQTLMITRRLDVGRLGEILSMNPLARFHFDAHILLGPTSDALGRLNPGLLGAKYSLFFKQRRGIGLGSNVSTALKQTLGSTRQAERMVAWAVLARAWYAARQDEGSNTAGDLARLINGTFGEATPLEQAWLLRMLPAEGDRTFQTTLAAAQRSEDALVRMVHMNGFVRDVDDPAIAAAKRSTLTGLREFAEAHRTALALSLRARQEMQKRAEAMEKEKSSRGAAGRTE